MQPPPQFEAQRVDGRHSNWIDGQPVATSGGLYELWARDGTARRLGEWPRSDARDVERALTALAAAPMPIERAPGPADWAFPVAHVHGRELDREAAWSALGSDSERAANAAIAAVLGWPADGVTWVAAGGLAPEPNRDLARRCQAHSGHGDPLGKRTGTLAVFLAGRLLSPNEVFDGLARLLATGARVLVVAAEENPMPAELAVRAASAQLRERGAAGALPLALIHAPTTAGWQAVLARPELSLVIGNLHGGEATEAVQALLQKAPALQTRVPLVLIPTLERFRVWELQRSARSSPFGIDPLADLDDTAVHQGGANLQRHQLSPMEQLAQIPLNRFSPSHTPKAYAELADTVKRAVACLFHTRSLGGMGDGSTGVFHVLSAIYSEVVELFRDELSRCSGFPTWPASALPELYEAAWRGAVDDGASLLCGGQIERTRNGPLLQPTLLVNVPPGSQWAQPRQPLAQVRLVRFEV